MFIIGDKGIGKKEGTGHSSEHSISKNADCVTKEIQCWYAVITTPVAMSRYEAGSEDRGDLYITGDNSIHVTSSEKVT